MPDDPKATRGQLILALNEIYHDLENRGYDEKHPDILEDEIPRWRRIASAALSGERPAWKVLDIGSGTGFVPLRLKEWLRPGDLMTCSDLSAAMLDVCRANLEKAGLECGLATLKLDGGTIGLPDRSQDLITLNAVMHHLPDPDGFCREIDRILKPGGRVLIGHEPTHTYGDGKLLVLNYWLMLPIADFKQFCYELILRLGWFEFLRHPLGRLVPELKSHNELLREVNDRLVAKGLIPRPLSAATLSSLLDAQSPDAGGPQKGRGFSRKVYSGYFPGYRVEHCETYNHLHKIIVRKGWMRRYAAWLAERFPEDGSSIFCGLRKPDP
jgi:ubiquinone/menaquinone biosynthesis C-methylase UbiE